MASGVIIVGWSSPSLSPSLVVVVIRYRAASTRLCRPAVKGRKATLKSFFGGSSWFEMGDVPGNVRQAAEARLEVGRLPPAEGEVVGVAEQAPTGEGRPPEEVQEEEEK
ncbi:hypothetical protein TYRP_022038 [Tyrophagus putrescentiae]|nr:hypothetical protein TYRP_022038 [Tyrophagus putrescentiae]